MIGNDLSAMCAGVWARKKSIVGFLDIMTLETFIWSYGGRIFFIGLLVWYSYLICHFDMNS